MAVILACLQRVHAKCFQSPETGGIYDCRDALAAEYKNLLKGVVVLFSHVIDQKAGRPEKHPVWRKTLRLGARVVTESGPDVTHVIAGNTGTEKVKWGEAQEGVHVVSPQWLEATEALFKRVPEGDFPVQKLAKGAKLKLGDAKDDVAAAMRAAGGGS